MGMGFERSKMQQSGGLSRATARRSATLITSNPSSSAKKKTTPFGVVFLFALGRGIRTIKNATVRWTVACRRSRRRQHLDYIESLILCQKKKLNRKVGLFLLLWAWDSKDFKCVRPKVLDIFRNLSIIHHVATKQQLCQRQIDRGLV